MCLAGAAREQKWPKGPKGPNGPSACFVQDSQINRQQRHADGGAAVPVIAASIGFAMTASMRPYSTPAARGVGERSECSGLFATATQDMYVGNDELEQRQAVLQGQQ